jgi:hypothetical protein
MERLHDEETSVAPVTILVQRWGNQPSILISGSRKWCKNIQHVSRNPHKENSETNKQNGQLRYTASLCDFFLQPRLYLIDLRKGKCHRAWGGSFLGGLGKVSTWGEWEHRVQGERVTVLQTKHKSSSTRLQVWCGTVWVFQTTRKSSSNRIQV